MMVNAGWSEFGVPAVAGFAYMLGMAAYLFTLKTIPGLHLESVEVRRTEKPEPEVLKKVA